MKIVDPFLAGSIVVAIALLMEKANLQRSRSDACSKNAWL